MTRVTEKEKSSSEDKSDERKTATRKSFHRPIDKKRKSNNSHVPRDHSCSKRGKICTSLFPTISYLRIVSRCWTRPTKNRKIPSVPAIDSYLQLLRLIASILTRLVRFSLNYTLDSLLNKLFDEGFNVGLVHNTLRFVTNERNVLREVERVDSAFMVHDWNPPSDAILLKLSSIPF